MKAGDQVSIISSYPCAAGEIPGATIFQVPLAFASFSAVSHNGRMNVASSPTVAKVASELRVGTVANLAQRLIEFSKEEKSIGVGILVRHTKHGGFTRVTNYQNCWIIHVRARHLATATNPVEAVAHAQGAAAICWVAAFPGARDSYQVPGALKQAGVLDALVTDWYSPMERMAFRAAQRLVPRFLSAKLPRRFNPGLPSNRVKLMPGYLVRTQRHPDLWSTEVDRLGRHAATLAAKHECGVLAHNHVATSAFSGRAQAKVLFQVQPHPLSVRDALRNDELLPDFKQEPVFNELRCPREMLDRYASEPLSADYCLTSCEHIKRTLIEHGVTENCVAVVPYGVDLAFFTPAQRPHDSHFTVLFTGQLVRQKGLHLLLEAWRRLSFPDSELRIASHGARNDRLLAAYRSHFTFLGALNWSQLRDEYRRSDLLCSPSLNEGFGLVNLEALTCGTPLLTSDGCGAADILDEGEDGFIVPAGELTPLMEKLEFAYRNRERLRAMRVQARAKAEQYPWSRFRATVVRTLASLEMRF